jgi:AcrR family transcriptional regulator
MARRTAQHAAETRQTIVDSALSLFSEHGFETTRTADVAREAGTSEGAVFHHFKDKRALFKAVVDQLQRRFVHDVVSSTNGLTAPMEVFLVGSRASLKLSENSDYLRIVMLEAQSVLGEFDWRQQDSRVGMMLIEPNLRLIVGRDDIPDTQLKPMALLCMGLINETIFSLARGDPGVSIDGCIALLETVVSDWAERVRRSL